MQPSQFVAHRREGDKKEQAVCEHLTEVSTICSHLADKIGVSDAGELLGLLHDLGKYGQQFQAYIQSATGMLNPDIDDDYVDAKKYKGKIDHSSAGAQWIWEQFRNFGPQGEFVGQIFALCLASHHSGLIDCLTQDGKNNFRKRMDKNETDTHLQECKETADKCILSKIEELSSSDLIQKCSLRILQLVDPKQNQSEIIKHFKIGLWTRFLFSCLIDADRMNSADFENPENKKMRPSCRVDWQIAIDRLENKLSNLPIRREIDSIRRSISEQCMAKAFGPQGIYTLTVPTGGGKTYSSIRYALHHAQKYSLDRIVYIIPYTSIIEQNAEAIRDLLEQKDDTFPWVLEHHSNIEPEKLTWRDKLITENWDAPIVFTTMVQFLDALFSGGTRGVRRMHQLANSVLIFDEIQTLPIKCVHLFCNAINFLVSHAKTTALLCTATQPLLDDLKSPDKGQLIIPKQNELVEDVTGLFDQLKRVSIKNSVKPAGWTEDEIAELALDEYETKGSCLVVVNTKKWAQQLYVACKEEVDKEALFHLSTSLCPAHRKKILGRVRQRLDDKLPVLCISTQLIEAGVDVDFASVIRFLAGLDSIAQAAGRCNRHADSTQATVYVVNPQQESIDMLQDIKEGRDKSLRVMSEKGDVDLLDPEVMKLYFSYYFYSRADEMDYPVTAQQAGRQDTLLNLLSDNSRNIGRIKNALRLQQSFSTAGRIFQTIDAPTQAVIVPHEEGKEIIADFCAVREPAKAWALLRRAQQFSVNVFPNVMKELKRTGAAMPVQRGEEIYYLDERYYSPEFGLSTDVVGEMEVLNAQGGKRMKNDISFRLWGRYALFTDPVTKTGGEKCSYHVPTYEAIKGVLKSIYWKPTIIWHVDRVRVMNPLRTQTKGTKPLVWGGGNSLAIYTFLHEVEYQVQAHFEWNEHQPALAKDRIDGKHFNIATRMLEKGGRQDIFLGVRDCQGYVEPCKFGEGKGPYDEIDELGFGLMFHGFDYPDETGDNSLHSRFWHATMRKGILEYPRPEECQIRRLVRKMIPKEFGLGKNVLPVEQEEALL